MLNPRMTMKSIGMKLTRPPQFVQLESTFRVPGRNKAIDLGTGRNRNRFLERREPKNKNLKGHDQEQQPAPRTRHFAP